MRQSSSLKTRVTVVGDVGLDVVCQLDGHIIDGHDTRGAITVTSGGAGGNTAEWLVRYGMDVSLIARVGNDQAGRAAASELTAAGIDCRFAVDENLATCCVVVLVADDGDRTMLADRGANKALHPADISLPEGPGHLHLSGYVLLDEGSRAAGLAALALAKQAGWTTSVDPQAAVHVETAGPAEFLSWVSGIDLLLPNDAELAVLGGADHVLKSVRSVVVTHGKDGASWHSGVSTATVPAPAIHSTDSTGAGDAFNAGLLAAFLAGASPEEALIHGVQAGTAASARVGARPGTENSYV